MGKPWETTGKPWKTMGKPWKTMENHGKTMENHGKPWKNHGKRVISWEFLEKSMETSCRFGLEVSHGKISGDFLGMS